LACDRDDVLFLWMGEVAKQRVVDRAGRVPSQNESGHYAQLVSTALFYECKSFGYVDLLWSHCCTDVFAADIFLKEIQVDHLVAYLDFLFRGGCAFQLATGGVGVGPGTPAAAVC